MHRCRTFSFALAALFLFLQLGTTARVFVQASLADIRKFQLMSWYYCILAIYFKLRQNCGIGLSNIISCINEVNWCQTWLLVNTQKPSADR